VVAASGAAAADTLAPRPARVLSAYGRQRAVGRVHVPGQGVQYPGMARGLYEIEAAFREEVDACCERLREPLGRDLRLLLFPPAGGEEDAAGALTQTSVTQPALYVVEHALARLWMSWGIEPSAMIGHSVGEYVAATLAGVLRRDDALALVASAPAHAVDAARLDAGGLCRRRGRAALRDGLALAAVNAPGLVVVRPHPAVDALDAELHRRGCR
jgi:acyl transferase domain-containing protein